MPSIDTLMPILKSFVGNLNCEIAATTALDTNMNLVMPTINGIMRISGDNLAIKENDMYRYMLAMSGIQNLDMSYRYHASVIKSPLPVKLGVDLYGKDFDNMKFDIGKAKYKNGEVPAFSAVIEETKINLLQAIRNIFEKGVDATINENIRQSAILDHKQRIGYVRAVDMKIEKLSAAEQKQVEETEAEDVSSEEAVNTENK